jgi:DNA repair protein RadB
MQPTQENQKPTSKIMTGSYDLNEWLEGGYEKGIITLLYGPAASGKSNFAILAACHNSKKNKKIIFIDTEGSFSLDRINQITLGLPEFVLKNIVLLNPTDFKEQKKDILQILKQSQSENIGLIIVDSITMLYRLELAEARKKDLSYIQEVNTHLAEQMKALHEIARKKEIPVLITGQVYNDFLSEEDWLAGKQANTNVVGGDILKYWSKCIIELQNNNSKKHAIIQKHRSLPVKKLNFEIVNEGIQKKKGWL